MSFFFAIYCIVCVWGVVHICVSVHMPSVCSVESGNYWKVFFFHLVRAENQTQAIALSSNPRNPLYPEPSIQHSYFLLQRCLPMTWNLDPLSHASCFFYVCSSSLSVWDSLPSKFSPLFTDFNLTPTVYSMTLFEGHSWFSLLLT